MSRPPANFVAEELQLDEDAEREAKAREWGAVVDDCERIGVAFAFVLLAAFAAHVSGVF